MNHCSFVLNRSERDGKGRTNNANETKIKLAATRTLSSSPFGDLRTRLGTARFLNPSAGDLIRAGQF
eukprot:3032948-Rhodomonas_salina.3